MTAEDFRGIALGMPGTCEKGSTNVRLLGAREKLVQEAMTAASGNHASASLHVSDIVQQAGHPLFTPKSRQPAKNPRRCPTVGVTHPCHPWPKDDLGYRLGRALSGGDQGPQPGRTPQYRPVFGRFHVSAFHCGGGSLRSQIVTSNAGRGGRRYLPYAFTEHGVVMLSSVLKSRRAVQMNISSFGRLSA
jgi:hypothetical protein